MHTGAPRSTGNASDRPRRSARRGTLLIIAEVRLRSGGGFGGAGASITAAKRARIVRAARFLLATQPRLAALAVRFDTLLLESCAGPIEWIEGAF